MAKPEPDKKIKGTDSCPNCGGTKKLTDEIVEELKKSGKLPKNLPDMGIVIQIPLPVPSSVQFSINPKMQIIEITLAICKKCMTVYCSGIELQSMLIQISPRNLSGSLGDINIGDFRSN